MSHSPGPESHDQTSEYELLPRAATPPPPDPTPRPSRLQRLAAELLDSWFYESFAFIFSVGCFVAIICTLNAFNKRPQPTFAYGLTLNAIVSTLATASKSSLIYVIGECIGQLKWIWFYKNTKPLHDIELYDTASRGPLGSVYMILQDKGRSLASLPSRSRLHVGEPADCGMVGAVVTILALAFDPFVQQVLTYPTRDTVAARNSSLAIAKQASVYRPKEYMNYVVSTGVWAQSLDHLQPDLTCPTGNCEWPEFQSVGICNRCEDITSQVKFECDNVRFNWTLGQREWEHTNCTIIPPQGPRCLIDVSLISDLETDIIDDEEVTMPTITVIFSEHTVWPLYTFGGFLREDNATYMGIANPKAVVTHFEMGMDNSTEPDMSIFLDWQRLLSIKKATQCAIGFCERTYRISVLNGTATFNVSSPDYGQLFPYHPSELQCWKPTNNVPPESINVTRTGGEELVDESQSAFCSRTSYNLVGDSLSGTLTRQYTAYNLSRWEPTEIGWPPDGATKIITDGLELVMANLAASFTKAGLQQSNNTLGMALASGILAYPRDCVSSFHDGPQHEAKAASLEVVDPCGSVPWALWGENGSWL
ncbi:DUF3176 domain-containing protein [Aspergillus mulundensis]|uniref:Uncharacterized protein n=1 Tax=Aspergillus mulundensis TaxID=1810919 RepID=A0A3D8RR22_9EURO|nr:hypothetical protein DSM5745_06437 [Aspergillus mulundensis]RDW76445.1 hypothetical protein DSM5745_06437 [Aspergillus mulundensis]